MPHGSHIKCSPCRRVGTVCALIWTIWTLQLWCCVGCVSLVFCCTYFLWWSAVFVLMSLCNCNVVSAVVVFVWQLIQKQSISKRIITARTNYLNETNNPRPELGPKSLRELSTAVINERSSGHRRWRWNHKSQMPAVLHRGLKHWKSPEVTETVIRRLVRLEQGVCWQAVPTY